MTNRVSDNILDPSFVAGSAPNSVRQSATADAAAGNNSSAGVAPAKAPAAPGKSKNVFTGLVEALNNFQRTLADPKNPNRKYDIADEYEIEFAPDTLKGATLKREGTTDKSKTPMQRPSPDAKNTATTSVNNNASIMPITAGMQIVQYIDQVMRNSSYITDQQTWIVDPVPDPVTGTQKTRPNPNPPSGTTAWYKISVEATQLGFDNRRNDHAYRMKYVISPYAINSLPSDWFKNSRYRGSHKSYNYWFTGANKEILNFEQEYNFLYRLVISGYSVPVQQRSLTDFRDKDQYRRTFLPTSENHAKGADGNTNEAGDNAASILYSPRDQTEVKLRIVGDPAWMQQGEVSQGVSAATFNFAPFANDGTINYDGQEVVFDISWNQPQDYDLNTGIVDVNNTNPNPNGSYNNQPQYNFTYTAITCKSIFSKGRFEQEIEGRLLTEFERNLPPTDGGRPVAGNPGTANSTRASLTAEDINNGWIDQNGLIVRNADVASSTNDNQEGAAPQLLNSPPPAPPTSNSNIDYNATPENPAQAGVIDNPDSQLRNRET
jgi:hypothetical protein